MELDEGMEECACVGSMGLHQNNLLLDSENTLNKNQFLASTSLRQLTNRSVIDVFRDIRDRYFGKPEIPKSSSRKASQRSLSESDEIDAAESIQSLPVYCKLMILSFLDTQDVCSVSLLNSQWHEIANDQILWRELLIRDMCEWDSMTNKSHPLISRVWNNDSFSKLGYGASLADLILDEKSSPHTNSSGTSSNSNLEVRRSKGVNFKALYIHSSFQRAQDDMDIPNQNQGLPGLLRSFWLSHDTSYQGEIIITGPGIDSPRTSKIFQSLMWGNEFLKTKGLLPGNRDGIGSGVEVLFKEKTSFNLIALYAGNSRVRETRIGMERLLNSNVVDAIPRNAGHAGDDESGQGQSPVDFVLHEAVRFYIAERKDRYKLIYAVDSSAEQRWEDVVCNRLELDAILKGTEIDANLNAALHLEDGDPAAANVDENNPDNQNHQARSGTNHSKRPLLVLSCVKDDTCDRLSALQVTAILDLPNVTDRQWRVQNVTISNMQGVEKGLEWLLKQT